MSNPLRDDVRNGLIETLADSEHALARDLVAYREVLHVAVDQLHVLRRQLDRLLEHNRHLRDECRRQREAIIRDKRRTAA